MITSKINASGIKSKLVEKEIRIDAGQSVITTLEIMLTSKEFELPVFEFGVCIGEVYFKDLILFLAHNTGKADLFTHKLNYTVDSAITIMMKISFEELTSDHNNI